MADSGGGGAFTDLTAERIDLQILHRERRPDRRWLPQDETDGADVVCSAVHLPGEKRMEMTPRLQTTTSPTSLVCHPPLYTAHPTASHGEDSARTW